MLIFSHAITVPNPCVVKGQLLIFIEMYVYIVRDTERGTEKEEAGVGEHSELLVNHF